MLSDSYTHCTCPRACIHDHIRTLYPSYHIRTHNQTQRLPTVQPPFSTHIRITRIQYRYLSAITSSKSPHSAGICQHAQCQCIRTQRTYLSYQQSHLYNPHTVQVSICNHIFKIPTQCRYLSAITSSKSPHSAGICQHAQCQCIRTQRTYLSACSCSCSCSCSLSPGRNRCMPPPSPQSFCSRAAGSHLRCVP